LGVLGNALGNANTSATATAQQQQAIVSTTTAQNATPTSTSTQPPTPVADVVPGCSGDWSFNSQDTVCSAGSSALTISQLPNAALLAQVSYTPAGYTFPNAYNVSAQAAPALKSCLGIGVLDSGLQEYVGYICSGGVWDFVQYDSTGSPHILSEHSVAAQSSYLLEMQVTATMVTLSINGQAVATEPRDTSFTTTQAVGLVATNTSGATTPGSGTFSQFGYAEA